MYAIIATGGKQYVASPGETIRVERLTGEPGDAVEFERIVAFSKEDGSLMAGAALSGVRVKGLIEKQSRGPKVRVFKFKRRKMYRRHRGHRQDYTAVKIEEITA